METSFWFGVLTIYFTLVCRTSAQIEINAKVNCTQDGFLPHPDNCRTFYWCSLRRSSRAIILECENDKIFDTKSQTCTFPWLSTREECGGLLNINEVGSEQNKDDDRNSGNDCVKKGFVADEHDCSKFYLCTRHENKFTKYGFYCGIGTIWDTESSSCKNPRAATNIKCGIDNHKNKTPDFRENEDIPFLKNQPFYAEGQRQYDPGYPRFNQEVSETSSYPGSNFKEPPEGSYNNIDPYEDECFHEGYQGDSRDSTKFYRCVPNGRKSFKKYKFSCALGTIWDAEINSCNYPWFLKNQEFGTPLKGDNTENIPVTKPEEKPDSYIDPDNPNFPEGDNNSQPGSQSNYPENPEISEGPDDCGNNTTINCHEEISSTTEGPTSTTMVPTSGLKGECVFEGFIPDPKDCKKFYRCVSNGKRGFITYNFKCGEGTVWNPEVNVCDHPSNTRTKCGSNNQESLVNETSEKATEGNVATTAGSLIINETNETTTKGSVSTTVGSLLTSDSNEKTTEGSVASPTTSTETSFTQNPTEELLAITTETNDSQQSTKSPELTTPKSHEDVCTQDGFMGDSNNCKKFYRCVPAGKQFIRYKFTCGKGTVWNADLQTCDHPSNTRTKCGTGEPIPTTDQDSLVTNETNEKTTEISVSTPTSSTETIQNRTEEMIASTTSSSTTNLEQSTTTTNDNQLTTETNENKKMFDVCSKDGFIGDSKNCKKFYRCVPSGKSFIKYEFTCGVGTVWDTNESTCNYPYATKRQCGDDTNDISPETEDGNNKEILVSSTGDPNTSSGTEESSTSSTSTTSQSTTVTTASSTDSSKSSSATSSSSAEPSTSIEPSSSTVPSTISDSSVTPEYLTISSEVADSSTTFSPEESSTTVESSSTSESLSSTTSPSTVTTISSIATDSPDPSNSTSSGSEESVTVTETTISIPEETTTEETKPLNPSSTETTTDSSVEKQFDHCKQEGFIGDSKNCKKFYRCVANGRKGFTKYQFTCGEGTIWDSDLNVCNHPGSVKNRCDQSGSVNKHEPTTQHPVDSTGSTTTSTEAEKNTISTVNQPESLTEKSTTIGSNLEQSTVMLEVLEPSGSSSKPTTESSQSSSTAATINQPQKKGNEHICTHEGFFGNKKNCNKFHRCVSNGKGFTKYDFNCGPGTIWDPDLDTCNHPYAVSNKVCEQSQPSTSEKPQPSSTGKPQTGPSGGGSEQSQDKCTEEGFHPSSEDCKKFFRCVESGRGGYIKYDFICGEGTIFDPNINGCNYPWETENRVCSQTGSVSPTTEKDIRTDSPIKTTYANTTTDVTAEATTELQTTTETSETTTEFAQPTTQDVQTTTEEAQTTSEITESTTQSVQTTTEETLITTEIAQSTTPNIQTTTEEAQTTTENVHLTTQAIRTTIEDQTTTEAQTTTTEIVSTTIQPIQITTDDADTTSTESEISTTQNLQTTTDTIQFSTQTVQTTTEDILTTTENPETKTESGQSTIQEPQTTTEEAPITTTGSSQTVETTTGDTQTPTENVQSTTPEPQITTINEAGTTEVEATTPLLTTTEYAQTTEEPTTTETPIPTTSSEGNTDSTEQTTLQSNPTTTENPISTTEAATTTDSSEVASTTTDLGEEVSSTTKPGANQTIYCPISEIEGNQIALVCPTGFRRHPKYCNLFYQCVTEPDSMELKVLVLRCPEGTVYDDKKIQCLPPENMDEKCKGEIKESGQLKIIETPALLPMELSIKDPLCPLEGNMPLHPVQCRQNFLKCQRSASSKLEGYINQCRKGYIYWPISKSCEKESPILQCEEEQEKLNDRLKWMIPVEVQRTAEEDR